MDTPLVVSAEDILADLRVRAASGHGLTLGQPAAHARDVTHEIYDGALPHPKVYRDACLRSADFRSIRIGDVTFHGIGLLDVATNDATKDVIRLTGRTPSVTFLRRSPEDQTEPNFIHTDRDMGDWGAILYLTPHPPAGDGTTFWRHVDTGAMASIATDPDALYAEWMAWREFSKWEPWYVVPAVFNRLVVWSAPAFHSRSLFENYGTGDDARLVQIWFGQGAL